MNHQAIQKRIDAAGKILDASTTTRAKFDSLKSLLKGINPKLDASLESASKAFAHVEHLQKSEVIDLVVTNLPDHTEEDKKRKKALLLFVTFWKDLKSEVSRVQTELSHGKHISNPSTFAKIFSFAKGPLGLITIAAVGIVALNANSVELVIHNEGCDTINPVIKMPFPIAGIKLPSEPISAGGQATATLPKINLTIDGTNTGKLNVAALGFSWDFDLSSNRIDILLNNSSLLDKQTEIKLGEKPQHDLSIKCP